MCIRKTQLMYNAGPQKLEVLNNAGVRYATFYPGKNATTEARKERKDIENSLTPRAQAQLAAKSKGPFKVTSDVEPAGSLVQSISTEETPDGARSRKPRKLYTEEEFIPAVGLRTETLESYKKPRPPSPSGLVEPRLLQDYLHSCGITNAKVKSDHGGIVIEADGVVVLDSRKETVLDGKSYYWYDLICAISSVYGGPLNQVKKLYALLNLSFPSRPTVTNLKRTVIWPTIKKLHDASVQNVIKTYIKEYRRLNPDHPVDQPVPVGLAMDGRWQKRYGWNSLDGHGIGHVFFQMLTNSLEAPLGVSRATSLRCK